MDNPIRFIDPDGRGIGDFLWGLVKGAANSAVNTVKGLPNALNPLGAAGGVKSLEKPNTDKLKQAYNNVKQSVTNTVNEAKNDKTGGKAGELTGNVLVQVGLAVFGSKGLDKLGKAGEVTETATVAADASTTANDVTVAVPKSRFPEAAQHIDDARANGVSTTGPIDRAGAAARRQEKLSDTPTRAGYDRDEVPPAVIDNGGNGSSVRYISPSDNRGAGAYIGNQIKNLTDGTIITLISGD